MIKPTCNRQDYERAIMMLEKEVRDIVELDNDDFGRYVQDQWSWKHSFETLSGGYAASAMRSRSK